MVQGFTVSFSGVGLRFDNFYLKCQCSFCCVSGSLLNIVLCYFQIKEKLQ